MQRVSFPIRVALQARRASFVKTRHGPIRLPVELRQPERPARLRRSPRGSSRQGAVSKGRHVHGHRLDRDTEGMDCRYVEPHSAHGAFMAECGRGLCMAGRHQRGLGVSLQRSAQGERRYTFSRQGRSDGAGCASRVCAEAPLPYRGGGAGDEARRNDAGGCLWESSGFRQPQPR